MKVYQKTIKTPVFFGGIGVHSGLSTSFTCYPADEDFGIRFRHAMHPGDVIHIGEVVPENAMHATVLRGKKWMLSTVEHLMAALMGLGIDNVDILVDGYEIPIADGSAAPFVYALRKAGLQEHSATKRWVSPRCKITLSSEDGRLLVLSPHEKCETARQLFIDYESCFEHPLLGAGAEKGCITQEYFLHSLAAARTFGFLEQLPFLRSHDLVQGSSLGNTIVLSQDGFLNDMRYENECVRHKVLDLFGDLALLGYPFSGSIVARKTGHCFNRLVVDHYLANPDCWELI